MTNFLESVLILIIVQEDVPFDQFDDFIMSVARFYLKVFVCVG